MPFTEIQEEIKEKAPEAYLMTLTRRFMMRITDRIREERSGLVIINGESLGQVASQTLESMQAINAVTCTPIIRPVVTMDKLKSLILLKKLILSTFQSNRLRIVVPFCTRQTKNQSKNQKCGTIRKRMAVEELVERAVAGIKVTTITPQADSDDVDDMIDDLL